MSQIQTILKKLYSSKNEAIKIRALVALCKLGSMGGTDASENYLPEGSKVVLSTICSKYTAYIYLFNIDLSFLVNSRDNFEMQQWALEGLSFLSLDAAVKEKLIEDLPTLHILFDLAKKGNISCIFGTVSILVNLTNSYEKKEVIPELIELAKFAKQHIPEQHPLDQLQYVHKRIRILVKEGITLLLVDLNKENTSQNIKELLSRIFNALCELQELRGTIVQQGGIKVLMSLASEGTDIGKQLASQALARIGISINPQISFPGQRICEVVRFLLSLLHPDCSGLQNFESLLALTNLSSVSEIARQRILQEGGLSKIEHWMFEEHEQIKRAAVQCITNLVCEPKVICAYEGENDRLKYIVLLCEDEDEETRKAAAGALAILTSLSRNCSRKITEVNRWNEIMQFLLANPNEEIQLRGIHIAYHLINGFNDVALKFFEVPLLWQIVNCLNLLGVNGELLTPIQNKIKTVANETIALAKEKKLIRQEN